MSLKIMLIKSHLHVFWQLACLHVCTVTTISKFFFCILACLLVSESLFQPIFANYQEENPDMSVYVRIQREQRSSAKEEWLAIKKIYRK